MSPLRGRSSEPDPGPRSEEERERARLEREARRAAREGRVPQTPAPPVYEPPAEAAPDPGPEPAAPEPEPAPPAAAPPPPRPPAEPAWFEPGAPVASAPTPARDVYPPASADRLARLPGPEPAAAVPVAAATPPAPAGDDIADAGPEPDDHPPDDLLAGASDDEAPIGTRTVRPERAAGVLGAASRGPRRRRPGRRSIVVLFLLLIIAAAAWFANALFQPFHGSAHGRVVVRIPPNSSSTKIGQILQRDQVVASSFFFALRARLSGKSSDLRPGRYVLQEDMTYADAITALNTPPKAAAVTNLTLPEGLSIREAAPLVKQAGVHGSYLDATARSSELSPRHYGAPKGTHSLEGFLFPATYQLRTNASVDTLVHDQVVALRRALSHVNMSYAHSKHLTVYDVLSIASMVERESASASDRKKIAAVIYNRLHDHIPLGIDATLRFALNDWNKPLTVSQLRTDTPYNTRIHLGLPPTPIGSPGLAAIQAAAHPAHVGYLYYVANPNGCGGTVFSSTNAKFQSDVAKYQAAVAGNHGKVPTCKQHK